jgi:lipopolysaccharide export system permease protein
MLRARTLRRYIAKRFLSAIIATFVVCSVLIYMIDMIELLRQSRSSKEVSFAAIAGMSLLRLPAYSEILLAFAVLVGTIGSLLSLSRKSELVVMRAGGMSVWQFLRPGVGVAFLLGVVSVTLYNPLAAAAYAQAERLIAEAFGREANLMAAPGGGSWLRQDGADGQSVMSAKAVANQGLSLAGVTVFQFDPNGRFTERIDADKATLEDGAWAINRAWVTRPTREPEFFDNYTVSTYLTRERVGDALGSEISVSFWQLPRLIEVAEKAGLSATRYRMQHELLLSRPILFVVMVLLGATVSLRSFRLGGIQTMVVTGMIGGVGFFLLTEISRQFGVAGLVATSVAVWIPNALAGLAAMTVLMHQEDG